MSNFEEKRRAWRGPAAAGLEKAPKPKETSDGHRKALRHFRGVAIQHTGFDLSQHEVTWAWTGWNALHEKFHNNWFSAEQAGDLANVTTTLRNLGWAAHRRGAGPMGMPANEYRLIDKRGTAESIIPRRLITIDLGRIFRS